MKVSQHSRVWNKDKVLLDSGHIKEIVRGLDRLHMSRTELAAKIGCSLCSLSKMLCYQRDVDGWLMPRSVWSKLNLVLLTETNNIYTDYEHITRISTTSGVKG